MSKKVDTKPGEFEQNVTEALSKSEQFIEKNQKKILMGVGIVILIVLGIMAFHNFYQKPRQQRAENAIYKAQQFFDVDSFKVALEGNGKDVKGFKQIASEYGMTPSGKLANAYTGICYYKLGKYQDAIKFLSQYDGNDNYLKTTLVGLTGDCYAELGETDKAQSYYQKAIDSKNDLSPIYLKKSGILYETKGNTTEAAKMYQRVKDDYSTSNEAYDIDKYLARVQK